MKIATRMAALAAALGSFAVIVSTTAVAAPTFVNGFAIAGDKGDQFGTSVNDGRLGFFSDLYYDPVRKDWWGLSDRGPGGGTISYETRVQRFTLDVNATTGAISNFNVAQTIKFNNGGSAFNGLAPNPTDTLGNALDPEGFVVNPRSGNLLVSDEYGPSLYEFDRGGNLLRKFNTPENIVARNAVTGERNFADDPGNTAGKRSNRGFEGLAISPDGKHTFAMLQSAMLDEGGGNGTYNRIVKFDNATGEAVAQFAYKMEGSSQGRGISALVALNDHEFMVLERNNRGLGVGSNLAAPFNKKVFKIDLTGATNLMGVDVSSDADDISITGGVLPPGVNVVNKDSAPFLDLAADTLAELDNQVPEKWEGLTIGPALADGTRLILAGTDNDYSVTQNDTDVQFDTYFKAANRIQCDIGTFDNCLTMLANGDAGDPFTDSTEGFRLIPGVLHAYKGGANDFLTYVVPVPEPPTVALLAGALGVFGLVWRRR